MNEAPARPRGRFLRMPDVVGEVKLSAPTINRLHRKGEFPKKVRISANAVGWWESEIEAWKAARGRVEQLA
jgi:prophage regulatory protein